VIRDYIKESGNKQLLQMLELIKGNVGFCFTKGDVKELRKEILSRKVQCAAKAGSIAPADVWVPAGGTGMEPTQTSFFQVMLFLLFYIFTYFNLILFLKNILKIIRCFCVKNA